MTRLKALGNAAFSVDGRHRYLLSRLWSAQRPLVAFGMLNPSRAGEVTSDNTVSACIRMAIDWGYGGLVVVNSASWVATDPRDMWCQAGADGGEANRAAWAFMLQLVHDVVFAWGQGVDPEVAARLYAMTVEAGARPLCLALCKDGSPHHPRGLARGLRPIPFERRV